MPIALPLDATSLPAMVTEHVIDADRLRQRGAVLANEVFNDWSLLTPSGRGVALSGLPGTLVLLDRVRLAPAANGEVDLSMLPMAWLSGARLTSGPTGMADGTGSIAGTLSLSLSPADVGSQLWALAGTQAGRGIAGLDARFGDESGWLSAGYTQGGALPTASGLAATGQGRWHLAGRFARDIGRVSLSGRALWSTRRDAGQQSDRRDLAVKLSGGSDWAWAVDLASGGQVDHAPPSHRQSSRMSLLAAGVSRTTGLVMPWATEAIGVAFGSELRRSRLSKQVAVSRELYGEAVIPLLQDRPAAENLALELGWRQAWIAGRSERLWQARARWEFFPGLALRGQVARGIDDLGTTSGIGRSIGLIAVPAVLPGVALAVDWRDQTAGPARVQAVDVSLSVRRSLDESTTLLINAMATHHQRADFTPLPVARFQSLLRVGIEQGKWALNAGWRHRSSLTGVPARGAIDANVELQLTDKLRIIASLSNANDAGLAPVGRQALLQLVAGF